MVTKVLNGIMLNRFLIIIFLFLISCSSNGSFSPIGKREFTKKIKFENPSLGTILINNYLIYRSSMPEVAVAKHNIAIHTALMNPKNGITYAWKHINTKTWPDQEFTGILKIVSSTNDNRGICRTWLEVIYRENIYKHTSKKELRFRNNAMTTACLNKNKTKYVLADEIFYDKID